MRIRDVGLHAPVVQSATLGEGRGRIVECIGAGIIMHVVAPDKWTNCEDSTGAESVLIARSEVKCGHFFVLVLARLIVVVGDLKPVPRSKKIEMKRIFGGRLHIEPVEDGA